jgi:uncharacterized protein YndB with AHSA1/START domain
MSDTLQMQIALKSTPDAILRAWTDHLPTWFAEYADISLADERYDFWGRYTPETPDRESGRHPLVSYEGGKRLSFRWHLDKEERIIQIDVQPRDDQHVLAIQVTKPAYEDFWFLSLENLRRHLDGKAPVRCNYSQSMLGDIHNEIDIDAPREAVFNTLIKPEQLERWIASRATVEPQVGGTYDWGWGGTGAMPLKILEIVPNETLKLSGEQDGVETILTWTLAESNGKTHLTLVHSGFAPDKDTGLKTGWLNFMSWVKSINEYGADWQPALVRLAPEILSFYPNSIGKGQAVLMP